MLLLFVLSLWLKAPSHPLNLMALLPLGYEIESRVELIASINPLLTATPPEQDEVKV